MSFKTASEGYVRYQGLGNWAYVLHRLTGLGVILFLIIHVLDTAAVYFSPSLYADAVALYRSPVFGVGEILLVLSVIYHGLNGLRIIYFDMVNPDMWTIEINRKSVIWTWVITLVLWLPAAVVMGSHILEHLGG